MDPKDYLTAISVFLSACALLYAWQKDRLLRRKEHADRVRRAAGTVVARLERYCAVATGYFDDVQPLLTEADALLVKEQDVIVVRDFLWRALVEARAVTRRRMLAEEVELSYVDLFGYDPRIQELFAKALHYLQAAVGVSYYATLAATQDVTLTLEKPQRKWASSVLGNRLRTACGELAEYLAVTLNQIVVPFRTEMTRVASAADTDIVTRRVAIASPNDVFGSMSFPQEYRDLLIDLFPPITDTRASSRISDPALCEDFRLGRDHRTLRDLLGLLK